MAGVCSVLFSSILSPVASSRSNFFQTIEELPIQDFISAIKGTILNYFRHFFGRILRFLIILLFNNIVDHVE